MKKIVLFLAILGLGWFNLNSQEEQDDKVDPFQRAFSPNNSYLNLGVNFFARNYSPNVGWFWNNYNYRSIPPIVASYEYGFHEYMSLGGFIGVHSYGWEYRIASGVYDYDFRRTSFGPRFSFHYVPLANEIADLGIDEEKFDFYATISGAINITREVRTEPTLKSTERTPSFSIGTILGFRYMFNNNFGVYIEGGRGSLGFANFGLTIKI